MLHSVQDILLFQLSQHLFLFESRGGVEGGKSAAGELFGNGGAEWALWGFFDVRDIFSEGEVEVELVHVLNIIPGLLTSSLKY